MFYAEIKDDHKEWHANNFWEKSPDDSADIRLIKNFIEIAPSRNVSKINAFLISGKSGHMTADILWVKNFAKITIPHRFQSKCDFNFMQ